MTHDKFTQQGAAATPQAGGQWNSAKQKSTQAQMPPAFRQPIETNRLTIQKEIAALRKEMGLPANAEADARLAKAEPEDFPQIITQAVM